MIILTSVENSCLLKYSLILKPAIIKPKAYTIFDPQKPSSSIIIKKMLNSFLKGLFQNCNVGAWANTLDKMNVSSPIGQPNIHKNLKHLTNFQETTLSIMVLCLNELTLL